MKKTYKYNGKDPVHIVEGHGVTCKGDTIELTSGDSEYLSEVLGIKLKEVKAKKPRKKKKIEEPAPKMEEANLEKIEEPAPKPNEDYLENMNDSFEDWNS